MLAFKDPIGSGTRDWSAAYDAENKQTFFCGGTTATCNSGNANAQYIYDGEGNRVQVLTSGVTTNYVYDAFGRLAAEYTTATPTVATGSYWRTTDHLGSTRLVTTGAGVVWDRRDLFPFGEQIANTYSSRSSAGNYNNSSPASRHLFTGKERDGESGLDYFIARYYSGPLGRFTSADAPFVDQYESDPQSWNLSTYTQNSPLRWIDPTGRCSEAPGGGYKDEGEGLFVGDCLGGMIGGPGPGDSATVTGEGGNIIGAFGLNFFFAASNLAGQSFSFLFDQEPQSLRQIPLSQGGVGDVAGGTVFVASLIGNPKSLVSTAARSIGRGHAFTKHVLHKGDLGGLIMGIGGQVKQIRTVDDLAQFVEHIMTNAKGADVKNLKGGRKAWWDGEMNDRADR